MLFDSLFKNKRHRDELVAQADTKIDALTRRRDSLDEARILKLKRQVELWAIMNLDPDSEEEYFNVTRLIASLIKEIAAIEEYMDDLSGARKACRMDKNCSMLEHLLIIEDPWAEKIKQGLQDALPRVAV